MTRRQGLILWGIVWGIIGFITGTLVNEWWVVPAMLPVIALLSFLMERKETGQP